MNRTKEIFDSGFTIDDIFLESDKLNNDISIKKTSSTKKESVKKFILKSIKLRNVSKGIYWNRNRNDNYVDVSFYNN